MCVCKRKTERQIEREGESERKGREIESRRGREQEREKYLVSVHIDSEINERYNVIKA